MSARVWHDCPFDGERCNCEAGSDNLDDCTHCQTSHHDDDDIFDAVQPPAGGKP